MTAPGKRRVRPRPEVPLPNPLPPPLSAEKHNQILIGAGQVFNEDGYEGASMSRIARVAGVSKGTLYNYFPSKAELFAAYVRQTCSERLARVFDDIPADGPAEHMLRLIGRRMLELLVSDTGLAMHRIVLSESVKFPALAEAFFQAGPQAALARMAALIRAQMAAGNLTQADPDYAAQQLVALVQTIPVLRRQLNLCAALSEAEITRMVDGAVALFLLGYAPQMRPRTPAG